MYGYKPYGYNSLSRQLGTIDLFLRLWYNLNVKIKQIHKTKNKKSLKKVLTNRKSCDIIEVQINQGVSKLKNLFEKNQKKGWQNQKDMI